MSNQSIIRVTTWFQQKFWSLVFCLAEQNCPKMIAAACVVGFAVVKIGAVVEDDGSSRLILRFRKLNFALG
jgi:hypothetical protein